ncbi:MAG: hypothetical protein NVSMB27_02470 [Ktedonobacteraceae bacterium]
MQRASVSSARVNTVPPVVYDVLNSPGHPLDAGTRAFMGPRFEHDFSQVRVHTDTRAAESARAVNALAYTVGRDIVFGMGQYAPTSMIGKKLLAHELTHVVQQGSRPFSPGTAVGLGTPDEGYEREAATKARSILSNGFQPAVASESHARLNVQRADSNAAITQDDSVSQTLATNATTPTPAQVPTATNVWTADVLNISLYSDLSTCFGTASPTYVGLYSDCGSPVRPPFCQSARVPFSVDFLVDRADAPRPQPFKPPVVSVDFDFVTSGGNHLNRQQFTDSAPRYNGANMPLKTSFGHDFPIGTTESGILHVHLEMNDVASGKRVLFVDDIVFDVRPCT